LLPEEGELRRLTVIAAGLVTCVLAGCGSSGNAGAAATATSPGAAATAASPAGTPSAAASSASPGSESPAGSVTVFAAASLQGAFTQIGKQFEASHPGDKVTFSFGPSSGLATQIVSGAAADVFASAAPANMRQVVQAGDASSPSDFAKNVMEVAVPPSNPAGVKSVGSLAKSSVKVALCQPRVPCGVAAAKVFSRAKITVRPVTLQPDVKSVLTQVELGNVDAGLVYVTDVMAAGSRIKGIRVPAHVNASTTYPIAAISKTSHQAAARAFVAYVMSPAGQKVLAADGFKKP
jgi:molybdate transport system substrate-binding protein